MVMRGTNWMKDKWKINVWVPFIDNTIETNAISSNSQNSSNTALSNQIISILLNYDNNTLFKNVNKKVYDKKNNQYLIVKEKVKELIEFLDIQLLYEKEKQNQEEKYKSIEKNEFFINDNIHWRKLKEYMNSKWFFNLTLKDKTKENERKEIVWRNYEEIIKDNNQMEIVEYLKEAKNRKVINAYSKILKDLLK